MSDLSELQVALFLGSGVPGICAGLAVDRIRLRPLAGGDKSAMKHAWPLHVLGYSTCSMSVLLIFALVTEPDPAWMVILVMTLLLASGVLLILEGRRARHEILDEGLNFRTLTQHGDVGWNQIERIDYGYINKWFRLSTSSGQMVRISVGLTNLPEFARRILDNVPPAKIDTRTHGFLKETARGNPPSLIGHLS